MLILLPTRVLGLPDQLKLIRGQRARNSDKALLRPLLQQEGVNTSKRFPCSLVPERVSWFLIEDEDMGRIRGRAGAVFGGLPTPSVVLSAGRQSDFCS